MLERSERGRVGEQIEPSVPNGGMFHAAGLGAVFCGQDDVIAALHWGIFLRLRLESFPGGFTREMVDLPR